MANELKLQVVLNAMDRITGPLKKINGSAGEAGKELKRLRDRMKDLESAQKDVGQFRDLSRGLATTRNSLGQAQDKVKALAQEMKASAAPSAELRKEFNSAVRTARDLTRQHDQQRSKLQEVRTSLSNAGISTKNLSQTERTLRNDIAGTNRQIDAQRDRLTRLAEQTRKVAKAREDFQKTKAFAGNAAMFGAAAGAAGYGVLRGGARLMGEGLDFEKTMSKTQALARLDKDSAELAALRQQARDLGATTMFSATEAAQGQSFLAMAGFKPKDIMAAMPGVLDMAKAGDMDLGRTADIASNVLGSFRMDPSEMTKVADILTMAFTTSNTSLEMLGETMKYVGPVASAAGMSLEEAAAMAGLLGNVGIQSSQAGTTMRAMLLRLSAPVGPAAAAMEELGLQARDAQGNVRSIPKLLEEVAIATDKMGSGERLEYLKNIFGEEPAAGMAELINQAGIGGIKNYSDIISQHDGVASKTAKIMGDNLTGDLDELSSAWSDVKITLFDDNNEAMRSTVQMLTGMVGAVGDWAKRNPELVATLSKLVVIIGILAAVLSGVALTLAAILVPMAAVKLAASVLGIKLGGAFAVLRGALPLVLTAVRGVGLALAASPIGMAITAIAMAALLIYRYWEPIRDFFVRMFSAIGQGAANLLSWLGSIFTGGASLVIGGARAAWNGLANMFSALWSTVSGGASTAVTAVGDILSAGASLATSAAASAWNSVETMFSNLWGRARDGAMNGANAIAQAIGSVSPLPALQSMFDGTLSWLQTTIPGRFAQAGSEVMSGLVNGIKGMGASVKEAVTGMGQSVMDWFKEKLGIHSPSRVFIGYGENVSQGAGLGIDRGAGTALQSVRDLAAAVAAAGVIGATPAMAMPEQPVQAPTLRFDNRPPLAAPRAAAPVTIGGDTININIQVPAGADPAAIAKAVRAELERLERERNARRLSSMTDYGD